MWVYLVQACGVNKGVTTVGTLVGQLATYPVPFSKVVTQALMVWRLEVTLREESIQHFLRELICNQSLEIFVRSLFQITITCNCKCVGGFSLTHDDMVPIGQHLERNPTMWTLLLLVPENALKNVNFVILYGK